MLFDRLSLMFTGLCAAWSFFVPAVHAQSLLCGSLELIESDATVTITQSGRTVLTWNKIAPALPAGMNPLYARSAFLHPVASPQQRVVTDVYPADHAHQSGIFSAWVRTTWQDREIDFWNLAGGTGRVDHERVVRTFSGDGTIGFECDSVHRAMQEPIVDILRDRWTITVTETEGGHHAFEVVSTQTALTDHPLLIKKYHYGGMAFRGSVRWLADRDSDVRKDDSATLATIREPNRFLNDLGSDRIKGNHEPSRWVSFTGHVDGQPVTLTVLSHRDNFRAPQPARIHPTKPYFVFSPCVESEFIIDHDHPLTNRYRFLITDAEPDSAWINEQWDFWCK
jgi:hypothetical protein